MNVMLVKLPEKVILTRIAFFNVSASWRRESNSFILDSRNVG